jgi:predicted amidohydrolase YtcJ
VTRCTTLVGLTAVTMIGALSGCRVQPPRADLILTNAHVHTLHWDDPAPDGTPARNAPFDSVTGWRPDAEAVAIGGGRILYVGSDDSAIAYRGPSTRLIDMRGKTIVPGLVDAHVRLAAVGTNTASAVQHALGAMAASGFTMVHDWDVDQREMHALEHLAKVDSLPVRVYALLPGGDTALMHAWFSRGADSTNAGNLIVRSLALAADSGRARYDTVALTVMMTHDWQLNVGVVDSAGNRRALDFIQRVMATNSVAAHTRPRVEGSELLDSADIPRFISAGVIVSTQPTSAVEALARRDRRSGVPRGSDPYPWRSLRLAGARLVFGSDLSQSADAIFPGLYAAMTRHVLDGSSATTPPDAQVMTAEEALRGFTSWAAYAGYDEWESGRIARGMRADLTVMTIDPLAVTQANADQLLQGKIAMTIVGGRVVFEH